ncbi:MAG: hypothetical protein U5K37_12140 [Natrialbaceae archaeon]|nr:hypothetical protein [Natrialbaceae archaeon]
MAYPEEFDGTLGWAPSYGSFQAFITAMRLIEGESATRSWLEAMVDSDPRDYPNEFAACLAIADGEIDAAFTNHYYIQRVLDGNPSAPIATAFTARMPDPCSRRRSSRSSTVPTRPLSPRTSSATSSLQGTGLLCGARSSIPSFRRLNADRRSSEHR